MENRHVIGVYESSEEVINKFENNNRQNQDSAGFSVIGEDKNEVERVSDELGVDMEPLNSDENKQGGGFLDKITSALKGEHEAPVEDTLMEMGVPEDEAQEYAPELEQGKMLVVGDPELAANEGADVTAGTPPATGTGTELNS
ncbi:general stress protein [Bacillus marinisedimentorum]|uniref:general stress protein n=1 Tax=Bacillus marinisedimentorum TaxID=1821260 RepID=UPI0007DF722D|nr:general stress protein [Bacillus marinisedimentorum]